MVVMVVVVVVNSLAHLFNCVDHKIVDVNLSKFNFLFWLFYSAAAVAVDLLLLFYSSLNCCSISMEHDNCMS